MEIYYILWDMKSRLLTIVFLLVLCGGVYVTLPQMPMADPLVAVATSVGVSIAVAGLFTALAALIVRKVR